MDKITNRGQVFAQGGSYDHQLSRVAARHLMQFLASSPLNFLVILLCEWCVCCLLEYILYDLHCKRVVDCLKDTITHTFAIHLRSHTEIEQHSLGYDVCTFDSY